MLGVSTWYIWLIYPPMAASPTLRDMSSATISRMEGLAGFSSTAAGYCCSQQRSTRAAKR